jgi:hypothetical protein
MKWHNGNDLSDIKSETVLCVVQYKYPVNEDENIYETYYDVMLFHNNTNTFSKQDDVKGIHGLRPDLIIRWAYIEEDDDIIEEEQALEAISAAVSHVKNLIQLLLTDCITTPKDYREKIGLDDLFSFSDKIAKRIAELDDHWES